MTKLQPITKESSGIAQIVGWMFQCPGCRSHHALYVKPHVNPIGASWDFNGDLDNPTFNPSILTKVNFSNRSDSNPLTCHLFVRDGKIQYLSDCTHELAGKVIDMRNV